MIPFLLGPIDVSSSFMLVSLLNQVPVVLAAFNDKNGNITYQLTPNLGQVLDPLIRSVNLPIFSGQGSTSQLYLLDNINGGGIGWDSNYQMINVKNPEAMIASQNIVANWNPPTLFLANVMYTFTTLNNTSITPNMFYVLPLTWYAPCQGNISVCCPVEPLNINFPGSLVNWFCNFDSEKLWCGNYYPVTSTGWTNLSDCTIGDVYTYCKPSQYCGNQNCRGPCSNINASCDFEANTYVCSASSSPKNWWQTPIFIGGIIGLSVIVILLLIIMLRF